MVAGFPHHDFSSETSLGEPTLDMEGTTIHLINRNSETKGPLPDALFLSQMNRERKERLCPPSFNSRTSTSPQAEPLLTIHKHPSSAPCLPSQYLRYLRGRKERERASIQDPERPCWTALGQTRQVSGSAAPNHWTGRLHALEVGMPRSRKEASDHSTTPRHPIYNEMRRGCDGIR
jgi:hypothetical protein